MRGESYGNICRDCRQDRSSERASGDLRKANADGLEIRGNDVVYPYVDPDKITTMFLFATSPLLSQSGNTKSSIKGNTLKEPLNKTPTADDGSFPPILRFEKWEICRSRWRQRSHTDAGMPFAGTQSIPPFSKPCLDEKSLAVHSR